MKSSRLGRIGAALRDTLRFVDEDVREKARNCYSSDTLAARARTMLANGTSAMILYRLMQGSRAAGLPLLEMLFSKLNTTVNGCVIGRGAEFGPGFVIVNSFGLVINGKVRGGAKVVLEHQVTLGGGQRGYPVLGTDVYIGVGARVLGGVHVGDRTRIGANAVVVRDVPDDTTAAGVPARIVRRRGR